MQKHLQMIEMTYFSAYILSSQYLNAYRQVKKLIYNTLLFLNSNISVVEKLNQRCGHHILRSETKLWFSIEE